MIRLLLLLLATSTLVAGWQCPSGSAALNASQLPPSCRTHLWDVQPLDFNNNATAGLSYLTVSSKFPFYNGVSVGRTYAHHPLLLQVGNTTVIGHSSALVDEDSMGQEVWGGVSHDGGYTWTKSIPIIPAALLPNQTNPLNFTYWCQREIPQRAWGTEGIVQSPITGIVYIVAGSSDFFCSNNTQIQYTRGGGRVARAINLTTGQPADDPCWLYQNDFTFGPLGFDKTVFGTQYGMKFCDEVDTLNSVLGYPSEVPAWSAVLYNNKFYAADSQHDLQEPTHAVYNSVNHIQQRFWRDISALNNSQAVWTECTCNETAWYPNNIPIEGNANAETNAPHPVYQTDIPDAKTKQYFGYFSTAQNPTIRYLVSNPRYNPAGDRFPLTLAWQGTSDTDDSWTFKHIGIVATNPSSNKVVGRAKNTGFSYPSAVQSGDNLIVAYSENKENIWVSVVPINSLSG